MLVKELIAKLQALHRPDAEVVIPRSMNGMPTTSKPPTSGNLAMRRRCARRWRTAPTWVSKLTVSWGVPTQLFMRSDMSAVSHTTFQNAPAPPSPPAATTEEDKIS